MRTSTITNDVLKGGKFVWGNPPIPKEKKGHH